MPNATDDDDLVHNIALVEACRGETEALMSSKWVGCFNCITVFPPRVAVWKRVAPHRWEILCPRCGAKHLLGDALGLEISAKLLEQINSILIGKRSMPHGLNRLNYNWQRRVMRRANPPY
jgi:hypothetical protein